MLEELIRVVGKEIEKNKDGYEMVILFHNIGRKYIKIEMSGDENHRDIAYSNRTHEEALELMKNIQFKRTIGIRSFGVDFDNFDEENEEVFSFMQSGYHHGYCITGEEIDEYLLTERLDRFDKVEVVENYIEALEVLTGDEKAIALIRLYC